MGNDFQSEKPLSEQHGVDSLKVSGKILTALLGREFCELLFCKIQDIVKATARSCEENCDDNEI